LIAGNFGIGVRSGEARHVVAAVSYVETGTDAINEVQTLGDVESGDDKKDNDPYIVDTPFFHLDLYSAVRAAESGLSRTRL
jgi:sodium-independent sulfate anion transporter 11